VAVGGSEKDAKREKGIRYIDLQPEADNLPTEREVGAEGTAGTL